MVHLARDARVVPGRGDQIAEDLFIWSIDENEREGSMIFSNHSCEPNIGVRGPNVFCGHADIQPGEGLTHDWAMTDDE